MRMLFPKEISVEEGKRKAEKNRKVFCTASEEA